MVPISNAVWAVAETVTQPKRFIWKQLACLFHLPAIVSHSFHYSQRFPWICCSPPCLIPKCSVSLNKRYVTELITKLIGDTPSQTRWIAEPRFLVHDICWRITLWMHPLPFQRQLLLPLCPVWLPSVLRLPHHQTDCTTVISTRTMTTRHHNCSDDHHHMMMTICVHEHTHHFDPLLRLTAIRTLKTTLGRQSA